MNVLEFFYILSNFIAIFLSLVWLTVYISNRNKIEKNPKTGKLKSITFLIPAFNEEKNIARCLKSLIKIDYPENKKKIIVVNDGSTDRTSEIVKKFRKFKVKLLNKENEGKAVAMNYGMRFVRTELVACMDADSYAESDYLKKAVGYFKNPKVVAVTTALKTEEIDSFWRKIQWVEYLVSIIFRKLFSLLDSQFVIPGAGGIYRTETLRKVGLFKPDNITEDMEIAMRFQSKGYKIENCLNAYVYTSCPKDFKALFKQRIRWYRGYLENFKDFIHMLNPKYGNFGIFFMPGTLIWISIIMILLVMMIYNSIYETITSLSYWFLINNQIMLPKFSLSIFHITTVNLLISFSILIGISLSLLGIKASKVKDIGRKKSVYILIYFFIYPVLFSFFWFCAIIFTLLRVEKKW